MRRKFNGAKTYNRSLGILVIVLVEEQWIEFKIPVLTMKVRILSESLGMRWLSDAYFFHRNMGLLHPAIMPLCKVTIFFLIQSILCNFLAYVYRFGRRSKATICGCGNEKIFSSASFEFS